MMMNKMNTNMGGASKTATTPGSSGVTNAGVSKTQTPMQGTEDAFQKLLSEKLSNEAPKVGADNKASTENIKVSPESKASSEQLKFSAHAIERMRSRGITYQPEQLEQIENAIARAKDKGSKDALVISGDSAMIVSVKNNTVVTVMDKSLMKDNVVTNIDSTIVL